MKKILEVSCNGLTNGGVQNVIMSIVRNLSDEYRFDILVFTEPGEYYDEEFKSYGGDIFRRLPYKSKLARQVDFYTNFFSLLCLTYKILKKNGPYEAIHCHNYFLSAACLMAAKLAHVNIRIVHAHNDLSAVPYSKTRIIIQKIYQKILNRYATIRVGCSKKANDYLYGKEKESRVVNNAIDLEKFNYHLYRRQDKSVFKILHVGNFSPQKNQKLIIEICKKLRDKEIDFQTTLIGGNYQEYYNEVCELIEKYDLKNYVQILPPDTNIPQAMRDADLFVFPSLYEGLGIVLIEAQAMRLTSLVSSEVPIEADLGNIIYVKDFEIETWIEQIVNYMSKYEGEKKKVDMSTYNIKEVARIYKQLYSNKL